jgi:hypothetical protein
VNKKKMDKGNGKQKKKHKGEHKKKDAKGRGEAKVLYWN